MHLIPVSCDTNHQITVSCALEFVPHAEPFALGAYPVFASDLVMHWG